MNHRVGSIVFGVVVGIALATWSYQWITDTEKRAVREQQENLVLSSRDWISDALALNALEFVDPMAPQRKVGKVYIYPMDSGWEISGYYRRDDSDEWHPYLLTIDASGEPVHLKVQDGDSDIVALGNSNQSLEVLP